MKTSDRFTCRTYQPEQRDELLAFAAAHPGVPAWPAAQIEAFLDRLSSGPDQVIDIWTAGPDFIPQRVLAAVLLDKVSNPGRHACLELLGLREAAGSPELFRLLIAEAQARKGPEHRGIQLAPAPALGLTEARLASFGAEHYYDMYEMLCSEPGALAEHVADPRAEELVLTDFDAYYQLLAEAFSENPDASLSELESAREAYALGGSVIWLIRGPRPERAPLAFLNLIPAIGEVRTLGVAPAARGQGLGKALLGHAMAWLAEQNISPGRLSVAVRNARALTLYLQMGFEITETSACWVLPAAERLSGQL